MPQPTRSGKHREEREFDRTQLHEEGHGQTVHRDYAAHFFRWVTFKEACHKGDYILDVGCGQDLPLIKVLFHHMSKIPERYVGVDLNRINKEKGIPKWATVLDEFNFIQDWEKLKEHGHTGCFNMICCFEVIEHMEPPNGIKLLKAVAGLMNEESNFFLSTPVFDGKAAINHLHEYEIAELAGMIEMAGLKIEHRWGTFGNVRDLEKVLTPEERILWDRWAPRLGNDGLSVVFATDHPDQSRNNLWLLTK